MVTTIDKEVCAQIALVISSCDSFCDTWVPFTHFFAKYWPDCPFESYLIINQLPVLADLFKPISLGADQGWSSNFIEVLRQLPQDYVLYLQDDYFLQRPAQTAQIIEDCAWCLAHKVDSLCFSAYPKPQLGFQSVTARFGTAALDSDGRTRCQFALWKKSSLLEVLRAGENAWEMESRGSDRTRGMSIMVYERVADAPIAYLSSAIVRGLWVPEALAMCRLAGIPIRPRVRGLFKAGQQAKKVRRALSRIALQLWLKLRGRRPFDLRRAAVLNRKS